MPDELRVEVKSETDSNYSPQKSEKQKKRTKLKATRKINDYEEAYAPLPENVNGETLTIEEKIHEDKNHNDEETDHAADDLLVNQFEDKNDLWYMCDGCRFGIPGGAKR